MKIAPSTKYNLILKDDNRDVVESHMLKIAERSEDLYMMDLFPILTDNNGFIFDGQHRYIAAELLGVPYYYMVTEMLLSDVARANANTLRYTNDDIVDSCTKMGLEPYAYVEALKRRFNHMLMSDIIRLNKSNFSEFADFKFVVRSPKYTERVAEISKDYHTAFDNVTHLFHNWAGKRHSNSGYRGAIEFLSAASGYDHDRMMKKIAKSPMRLIPAKTRNEAMVILTSIYNSNVKSGDTVELSRLKRDLDFNESPIVPSVVVSPKRGIVNPYNYSIHVESSTDYDRFHLSPYRRSTTKGKIESLTNEIERSDWLRYYPIVVDGNNTVVDGQRRFMAAKALQKPFFYIRAGNVTFPMMMSAGVLSLSWGLGDYAKHYSQQGNKNYIELLSFLSGTGLSLHAAINSFVPAGQFTQSVYRDFRIGRFKFEKDAAYRWFDACKQIIDTDRNERDMRTLRQAIYRIVLGVETCDWAQVKTLSEQERFWRDGQFVINEFVSFVTAM